MANTAALIWSSLFGVVGLAYFVYGKKQNLFIPLFCGIALMAYPYFVANVVLLVIIGVVVAALPYFFRD